MSDTFIQESGPFITGDAYARGTRKTGTYEPEAAQSDAIPVGYRRVSRRWRVLPDGTRDYAVFHGKSEFTFLLPVSSRVRTPSR